MSLVNLEAQIRDLLAEHLNLEGGEMMMPLKQSEIGYLHTAIHALVTETARALTEEN